MLSGGATLTEMAVEQDEDTEDTDERQKSDTGFNGVVSLGELEVQRDVVDGNEAGRVDSRGHHVQKHCVVVSHEVTRENASLHGGEDGVGLLDGKGDK